MKSTNSDEPTAPPAKKLRQATLPFLSVGKGKLPDINKKRKKSDSEGDDCQVLKVLCSENNSIVESSNEIKSSDDTVTTLDDTSKQTFDDTSKQTLDDTPKENIITLDDTPKKNITVDVESENEIKCEDLEEEKECEKESAEVSSPLQSANVSDEEEELESANTSINMSTSVNMSALLDGDDKDSLMSLNDIPLTPMKTPTSVAKKPRKLTPKQIQKNQEVLLRKEEKEREREEKERLRLEEKEAKRKLREEKEEQRKQEKLEKERKRQAEIDQKNEEKRAREDERRKREEEKVQEKKRRDEEKVVEKKRKEDERLQKEEEKRKADEEAVKKKEKAVAAFASFFVPRKSVTKPTAPVEQVTALKAQIFMPFQIKIGMRLAPTIRSPLDTVRRECLDLALASPVSGDLYVQQLAHKLFKPKHQGKTWPYSDIKNEVVVIDDATPVPGQEIQINAEDTKQTVRAKLLQFHENKRPPYWGTWRKKSPFVRPRRPLGQDKVHFDYEIDSDDEWEEEEPGESIKGSDDEADKESDDDYEVDNEFFVPHGYLSDEEAGEEEAIPPEAQKERLKMMEREFVAEMKQKKQQLKPRVLGIFILSNALENKDPVYNQLLSLMKPYTARRIPTLIPTSFNQPSLPPTPDKTRSNGSSKRGPPQKVVPEEAVPDLIRLIHGNRKSQTYLTREFVAYWLSKASPRDKDEESVTDSPSSNKKTAISIANVSRKMKELASWTPCPEEGSLHTKMCWYVPVAVRETYGLLDLALPNQWKYITVSNKKVPAKEEPKEVFSEALLKPETPLITKFTTKLSEEERQKQIQRKSIVAVKTPTTTSTKPKLPVSPFGPLSAFCTSPSTSKVVLPNAKPPSTFNNKTSTPTSKTGRRVSILVSVPRGQEIPSKGSNSESPTSDNKLKSIEPTTSVGIKNDNDDDCMIVE